MSPGSILVTGFPITSAFPVGPNGVYGYVFSIPPAYPLGRTTFAQFVTIDPATLEVWATIPLHVHVNH